MYQSGYLEGKFTDESRADWNGSSARPISWSCWYPAPRKIKTTELNFGGAADLPLFTQGQIALDAMITDAQNQWPLVLLSHGTGGSAAGMSWLGARLARNGYICIGVDHHGNTASEPYRAEGFICWWERPSDLSFILDRLDSISTIVGRVDSRNISVAGFSLGGYTALALVGGITSMDMFDAWIKEQPDSIGGPSEFPGLNLEIPRLLKSSARFRDSWEQQGAMYLDARISQCVALAPAPPVRAFTPQSVRDIKCPTLILSGEADLEAPYDECAEWLKKLNPSFHLVSAGKNAGHYVFLPECTAHGKKLEPEICIDHPQVSRLIVHDYAASNIVKFMGP